MKKKILCALLTLAMTATLFSGCSGNSDSSDSTSSAAAKDSTSSDKTLKVAVFDMPTLYLMQTFNDMGFYKDNGANVEFTYFPVYSDAISAYNTGNADVIIYAVAEAVTPVVNGIDSKVIGVIDTSNGLDGIAATNDIKSVKDLKGKTVATEIGTVDHMMLQKALEKNGLSEDDVNLVNMSAGDAAAAMTGGSIDAVSTWEPQLGTAAKSGRIIYSTKEDPDLIADVFLIHSEKLDEQYDNAKAFVKTWYESMEKYKADPSKYAAQAAKKGDLSEDEFYQLMDVTNLVSLKDNKVKFTEGKDDYKYLNILVKTVGSFLYDGGLITTELTDDMVTNMLDPRIVNDLLSE